MRQFTQQISQQSTSEAIIAWMQQHFYFVIIGAGLLILVGCIFNWQWVTRMPSQSKLIGLRTWVEELHGVEGRLKLERVIMTICALILIGAGIAFWILWPGQGGM